jgi:hypothetical protein
MGLGWKFFMRSICLRLLCISLNFNSQIIKFLFCFHESFGHFFLDVQVGLGFLHTGAESTPELLRIRPKTGVLA